MQDLCKVHARSFQALTEEDLVLVAGIQANLLAPWIYMESLTQCETTTPLKPSIISCNHLARERDASIIPGKRRTLAMLQRIKIDDVFQRKYHEYYLVSQDQPHYVPITTNDASLMAYFIILLL
jgi:hypothetical protein